LKSNYEVAGRWMAALPLPLRSYFSESHMDVNPPGR
jgi:hypothetical protein